MAREHYSTVKEYSMTTEGMAFRVMIKECIDALRKSNDTATTDEFLMNKGAIRELKKLLKNISPVTPNKEFNGAYDE